MRYQLLRFTLASVLLSVLIIGVPLGVAGWWALADNAVRLRGWLDRPDVPLQPVLLLAIIAVLSVIAVLAGVFVASLQARKFAEPMTQLADRAERLGAGESRFQPLVTGIGEVDRVSEVLARSAHQMTRSLASERDFASDASHQLRTPLTALLMRLEEISVTDDLEVVQEEAGIAIAQVERLTKVVDELLSRSRRGHDAPPPSVSLDSVIAALQREWQPAFEQARRSVRVHGQRGLSVRATPVALSQVLSTLLENSLRTVVARWMCRRGAVAHRWWWRSATKVRAWLRRLRRTSSNGRSARRRAPAWGWPWPVTWRRPTAAASS